MSETGACVMIVEFVSEPIAESDLGIAVNFCREVGLDGLEDKDLSEIVLGPVKEVHLYRKVRTSLRDR